MNEYPYLWTWGTCGGCVYRNEINRRLCPDECRGKYPELEKYFRRRCRVVLRGAMNMWLIEFEDGVRFTASGNGLRKVKEKP